MYSISLLSKPFSLVLINFSSFPLLHIKGIKILPKHPSIILTLIVKKKKIQTIETVRNQVRA